MAKSLITVFELLATITVGMMIALDIIAAARLRASLVRIPIRISRRQR